MSAGFDAYGLSQDSNDNRPYDRTAVGGTARVGLPITEDLELQLNYKIDSSDLSNITDGAEPFYSAGTMLDSSVGYGLFYSTLDNPLDPRNGIHAKFTQDVAGVGGDVRYVRSVADARYYHELLHGSDITGMVRLQGGNIVGLGEDVQTIDNFFKGGETIRGFASYGIGARYSDPTVGSEVDGLPLGGKNYVAATAEVQFPLPILPSDFGLRGALFADAGTLFGIDAPSGLAAGASIEDDASIRSSVGASILWASPFGLLRGDFAYALTKEDYDKTQIFRFSAGTQF
jgi:outer membrane protein insertion porin family